LFLGCLSVAVQAKEVDQAGKVRVGEKLPRFGAFDMDGNVFTTERLFSEKGAKGFVFQFFASSCEPCKFELIEIEKAKKKFQERGITVVLVDLLEDRNTVKSFLQKLGVKSFRVVIDETGGIVDRLALNDKDGLLIPLTIVVDPQGIVKGIFRGNGGKDYVEDLLKVF
jgi:peroxiredoxin